MSDEPAPEPTPDEPEAFGLIHIEFGLQPFRGEPSCPKCNYPGIQTIFHPVIVMNVGRGQYPCSVWYGEGILTGSVGEHLCLRCTRCGYGWPTRTADTYTPPENGSDTPLDPEGEPT